MSSNKIEVKDHNDNVIYTRLLEDGEAHSFALVYADTPKRSKIKLYVDSAAATRELLERVQDNYNNAGYRTLLVEVVNGEVCLNPVQMDHLTGTNDASRSTYKMFIPVNPEPARRARRSRSRKVTEYEVRYIDAHGDAIDVDQFSTLEDAITEACMRQANGQMGRQFMSIVIERVDNTLSTDDRLLDKKHSTVYTCGDLSALWAWGHVGPHVGIPVGVKNA